MRIHIPFPTGPEVRLGGGVVGKQFTVGAPLPGIKPFGPGSLGAGCANNIIYGVTCASKSKGNVA